MARPKGIGGKTPERIVSLLREEVDKTSQAATARATGLTLAGVQNYLKGIGEPTTATLEKLADYFGVTVAWLRGEERSLEFEMTRFMESKYKEIKTATDEEIDCLINDYISSIGESVWSKSDLLVAFNDRRKLATLLENQKIENARLHAENARLKGELESIKRSVSAPPKKPRKGE